MRPVKRVRYNGKRYNYYAPEGEETQAQLVLLDDSGKETQTIITEFEEDKLEELKMFDEEYVKQLREEAKTYREQLQRLKQELGDFTPEQLQQMAKELQEAKEREERERLEQAKKEGKWQEILDAQKQEYEQKLQKERELRERAERTLEEERVRYVLTTFASKREDAVPGAVPQVVDLMRKYVKVDKDGHFLILDDDGVSTRLKPDSTDPMTVEDFVNWFFDKNPWFTTVPSTGGAGSGGEAGGGGEASKNPWKKETWNLTEQGRLLREDPVAARKLMSEAGIPTQ